MLFDYSGVNAFVFHIKRMTPLKMRLQKPITNSLKEIFMLAVNLVDLMAILISSVSKQICGSLSSLLKALLW